jgi:hypothetical protein
MIAMSPVDWAKNRCSRGKNYGFLPSIAQVEADISIGYVPDLMFIRMVVGRGPTVDRQEEVKEVKCPIAFPCGGIEGI